MRAALEAEARKAALSNALVRAEEYADVPGWEKEARKAKEKVGEVSDVEVDMLGGMARRERGKKKAIVGSDAVGMQFVPKAVEVDAVVRVRFEVE